MFMARQPTSPAINVLQAVVDIATAFKDPKWVKSLIDGAEAITAANELTGEEAEKLSQALEIIEQANKSKENLKSTLEQIEADKKSIADQTAELLARELRSDKRTSELDVHYKLLADEVTAVSLRESKVQVREDTAAVRENEVEQRASVLDSREKIIAQREAKFEEAHKLLRKGE